ncbi:MAG: cytochrome P450 [Akkermansiaceae bacterium]|nr:cytochrome P450 [Armatimonadota bacterium]
MAPFENVQIASPAFKADPHPFYARLRAEAPVCRVRLPDKQEAYLVSRYDDVLALLKDPRFAKDRHNALTAVQLRKQPWIPPVFAPLLRNMLGLDDPDHARLRALVQKAFTPRRIEQMAERIGILSDRLLDDVEARRVRGHPSDFDLIRDFATPLPVTVIADLLGVPPSDRENFARWSNTIIKNTASPAEMLFAVPDLLAFVRFLRRLIRERRAAPRDDLTSALVQAEEAGDRLSEDELLAMMAILLTAGHETTVHLIGNGVLTLLQHPAQLECLRAKPTRIKVAVEELLRYASPVDVTTQRYAREDLEFAGTSIPRGALVFGVIGSANRDERQFENPDTLDIARQPNRHLAFGQGSHYCVGASLARMEGQIAINTLLRRFPGLRLAESPDRLRWRRGLVLRGLESLPLGIASALSARE